MTVPVFGQDRDPGVVTGLGQRGPGGNRSKSGTFKTNPMLAVAGLGPDGRQCVECRHLFRVGGVGGRYYKCDLRRVTSGAATDHRVRWPACGRFAPVPEVPA